MRTGPVSRRAILQAGAGLTLMGALAAKGMAADMLPSPSARIRKGKPLVLGHRGCPALRPEHTLASYAKAIEDGADFVEPDLVSTRDGVLVARHENNIAETTDVANHAEFAALKTVKIIDGERQSGWFTEDFTFAELKTLRARERLGTLRPESRGYDGQFQIVSLEEIADFIAAEAAARDRIIGLVPEVKHSTYFAGIGLPIEPRLTEVMRSSHYLRTTPVIIQSFETENLKTLRTTMASFANVQLMQLIGAPTERPYDLAAKGIQRSYTDMLTTQGLKEIAGYADYLAPSTRMIIPLGSDGRLAAPTGLVEAAHQAGLLVGTWTFRPENRFLAADFRNGGAESSRNPEGSIEEMRHYIATGIDAFFTDDPRLGQMAVSG